MTEEAVVETPGADVIQENEVEAEAETNELENAADSPPAGDENADSKTQPLQERLNKLTRNWRETERKVEEKDRELAELRRQLAEAPKEPDKTLADFDYDNEKYLEYRLERVESEAVRKAEDLMTKFQGQTQAKTAFEQFQEREVEFQKSVDDYDEVVSPDKWACSQVMASKIHKSDVGPEMAYHLASNPDVAMEIAKLSDLEAVERMVLLELDVKSKKSVKPKKVSDAPPPPPKIKAGDAGMEKDVADMSDSEFAKWRRKQIANR